MKPDELFFLSKLKRKEDRASKFWCPLLTSRRGSLEGRCERLRLMLCMPGYWKKAPGENIEPLFVRWGLFIPFIWMKESVQWTALRLSANCSYFRFRVAVVWSEVMAWSIIKNHDNRIRSSGSRLGYSMWFRILNYHWHFSQVSSVAHLNAPQSCHSHLIGKCQFLPNY